MDLARIAESRPDHRRARYVPPAHQNKIGLSQLLAACSREVKPTQRSLFLDSDGLEPEVWWSGSLEILNNPCASVIGARDVSDAGRSRARRIARELSDLGVTVVSGLARGVDFEAHTSAIAAGGKTVAVIGTPINRVYPVENTELQQKIAAEHLLLSQFQPGQRTFPSDFPKRNRLMAAVSDASIIVEASDTSGTLHQASECVRLGRWLFILKSVVDNHSLTWPSRFLKEPRVVVMSSTDDLRVIMDR